jgi:hypothetical protein
MNDTSAMTDGARKAALFCSGNDIKAVLLMLDNVGETFVALLMSHSNFRHKSLQIAWMHF